MTIKNITLITLSISFATGLAAQSVLAGDEDAKQDPTLDTFVVWGEQKASEQAGYTSPVSTLKPADIDEYYGERGLRGKLLPRGFRQVSALHLIRENETGE